MADHIGQQFGQYRLIRFLGHGSFGEVYLGEHGHKQTLAGVKLLQARLTPEDLKEFINEASTTFRLQHPNIVQLLDFGLGPDNTPFLAMAYAPNGTLRQRHPKGTRLPLETIIAYVNPIVAALQHAHDERLIHRDVKPENICWVPTTRSGSATLASLPWPIVRARSTPNNPGEPFPTWPRSKFRASRARPATSMRWVS